ncbi:thioester domain-containing protein [Streptomyces sp. NBC_01775]|uniref:thioester domain-containing protein n=1 Tax=Streptomyces sp. NBC_01775 TaxID=2975939 RepID=UPI002DD7B26C|nr:thioester domain-containing protein [Streptomyces sp. NBC_01775]WSB79139.1 thioester domain-containing protein [Streptomyces sp. NBC_01775]
MTSVRGRTTSRLALITAATGLCVAGMAAVAAPAVAGSGAGADVPEQRNGAIATLNGLQDADEAEVRVGDETQKVSAGLFEMAVDGGGTLQTYGVDALNPIQEQSHYAEGAWKSSSLYGNRNAGKIRWVLEHSYPRMNDLQALAKAAHVKRLTPETAAAGTQVAIWRFAENGAHGAAGARPAGGAERPGRGASGKGQAVERPVIHASDPSAEKLAKHLVKAARQMSEPKASLALDPAEVSGRNGERPGPVTVRTNAPTISVAPQPRAASQGVRVVNEKGKLVDSAVSGTKLYFDVPAVADPGTAGLTVQAATKIPVGRVFTGTGEKGRGQTQILAGSSQSTVSATATVNWAKGGPVPAAIAEENCAKGGVDIAVSNGGDATFAMKVGGQSEDIEMGKHGTLTVPVKEDQPYRIPLRGPNGYKKTFSGVLDCATSAAMGGPSQQSAPATIERPATVGGGGAVPEDSGDLAETGGGDSWLIAVVAAGFLIAGALTMVVVRRRA